MRNITQMAVCLLAAVLSSRAACAAPTPETDAYGDITVTLPYAGASRSYILHVPAGYTPSAQWPLLLVATGAGGSGSTIRGTTRFDSVAPSAFIAYPNPAGPLWQLTGPGNDVGFFEAVVTSIATNYAIDPARVFIAGFSDGGRLAITYACSQAPGTYVAGLATVADDLNTTDQAQCEADPPAPAPMLTFHGTADPISPYGGGRKQSSAQATAQFFAGFDSCTTTASFTRRDELSSGAATTDTDLYWTGCANGNVSFWTVNGGGHSWPGSLSAVHTVGRLGPVSLDLPASAIIWRAFRHATQPANIPTP